MATSFPTSLDALVNPLSTDTLDSVTVPHDLQHTNANDAIEALEAKVGINGSADTNSIDYKLTHFPLDNLIDVTAPTPTSGDVLSWSGSAWVNSVPAGGSSTLTIANKTTAYTVISTDLGKIINCTSGTFTVSITAAATLGAGFNCWIWNTGTGVITIDPNSTETIEGSTTIQLAQGQGLFIICDATNWKVGQQKINGASLLSTTIGRNSGGTSSQAITGAGAMALGGSYASGTDSFAAAIANNTSTYGATGANSVAIGRFAKASASNAIAIGLSSVASGLYSAVLGGNGCNAQGGGSFAIGGGYTSNGAYALAVSSGAIGDSAYVPTTVGKLALSCSDGGFGQGANQKGITNLRKQTTDGTASVLTSDAGAAGATNQVILPNNAAYTFTGTVISKQSGSTNVASWKIEGVIVRGTTAASTTLVASTITAISNIPAWTLALSADTTNGGLAVTFTGAVATNIRTVCTIESTEVIYA